ncbi:12945_t:CDS:2 [Funneliformis caledonium]|uniref:12945_t:CDS:1 n=1 Tax=Funneliformis caledonium TaxID=1117310 RepID=A0A9N9FZV5_9GLOM|nr:12945_t:CDS:2 [Funneliformis caledonium]
MVDAETLIIKDRVSRMMAAMDEIQRLWDFVVNERSFCMYRIKVPKYNGYSVPKLANPDIVELYSRNVSSKKFIALWRR